MAHAILPQEINQPVSFARGGLSAGSGQVYLVTFDNTLDAFGIPMEH